MSNTLTVRLPEDLARWLEHQSEITGLPKGQIIRSELERARSRNDEPWMSLVGSYEGPGDLSTRKGLTGQRRPGSPVRQRKAG